MSQSTASREFSADGDKWVAWPSGGGAYGTGGLGVGSIQAVHFARAAEPQVPLYEALLPAGRFWALFDDELLTLFRSATRIVDASQLPHAPIRRRARSLEERPGPARSGDRPRTAEEE